MRTPHLLGLLRHVSQVRGQEAGPDTPDLDAVRLQLVVPVQHQHVEGRLAAAVSDGLEAHLLGPAGRLRRGGEVRLRCLGHVGETGHEEQAGVGRLEQERHECPSHDLGADDVDVIGLVEAVAERDFAGDEFKVEGGPWEMLVRLGMSWGTGGCTYQHC